MVPLRKSADNNVSIDNTASVAILAANEKRLFATISNSAAVGLWLGFGRAAVIGKGTYVPAGGGYQIDKDNMWRGAVNGIMASGTAVTIAYTEFT
jgi:hypothetical protein